MPDKTQAFGEVLGAYAEELDTDVAALCWKTCVALAYVFTKTIGQYLECPKDAIDPDKDWWTDESFRSWSLRRVTAIARRVWDEEETADPDPGRLIEIAHQYAKDYANATHCQTAFPKCRSHGGETALGVVCSAFASEGFEEHARSRARQPFGVGADEWRDILAVLGEQRSVEVVRSWVEDDVYQDFAAQLPEVSGTATEDEIRKIARRTVVDFVACKLIEEGRFYWGEPRFRRFIHGAVLGVAGRLAVDPDVALTPTQANLTALEVMRDIHTQYCTVELTPCPAPAQPSKPIHTSGVVCSAFIADPQTP